MQDVSEIFRGSGFKIFARILETSAKGAVWAIPAPSGGSRAFCDRMNSWAQGEGQPGLGHTLFALDKGASSAAVLLPTISGLSGLKSCARNSASRTAMPCSSSPASREASSNSPGRAHQGRRGTRPRAKDRFELCWIVDFPMYEWNEEEKKIDFSHNPFSMPNAPIEEFLALDPSDKDKILALNAIQYDIVCNGVELSSGAHP